MFFTKKMADPTYCGPPFFQDLRYLDISQSETMYLNAVFFTQNLNCDFYRSLAKIVTISFYTII